MLLLLLALASPGLAIDVGIWNIGDVALDVYRVVEGHERFVRSVAPHGGEFFAEDEDNAGATGFRLKHPKTKSLAGEFMLRPCTPDPVTITVRWCESCPRLVSGDNCDDGRDWREVCPHAASVLSQDSGGQPGMHVVCRDVGSDDRVFVIADGRWDAKAVALGGHAAVAQDLFEPVRRALGLVPHPSNFAKPAMFSIQGNLISPLAALPKDPSSLLWLFFEGGFFQWPAPFVGAQVGAGHGIELRVLSTRPKIFQIAPRGKHKLLDHAQCRDIIDMAVSRLAPSSLAWQDNDDRASAQKQRTSSNTFLPWPTTSATTYLGPRITALLRLENNNGEEFQVLRYDPGERYVSHVDFFRPENYVNQPEFHQNNLKRGASNRFATAFIYLNDAEGGETHFARAYHGHALDGEEWSSCSHSNFSVTPEEGKVILFYNLLAVGAPDHYSVHAGCPAVTTKFAANLWYWNDVTYGRPGRPELPAGEDWCWQGSTTDTCEAGGAWVT